MKNYGQQTEQAYAVVHRRYVDRKYPDSPSATSQSVSTSAAQATTGRHNLERQVHIRIYLQGKIDGRSPGRDYFPYLCRVEPL